MHLRFATAEAPRAACRVASHALVEAELPEIPGLRDQPGPAGVPPLPQRFLRHCDEQTVVGMRAVLAAIAAQPDPRPSYAHYGVVAAACRPGRIATAGALALFRTGGGATVSPHIVPQCSLHSLAGAVSVALGMHGPHVGSSGGPRAVSEGLFTAFSLLSACGHGPEPLPGLWLVLTGWTTEPALDSAGRPGEDPAGGGPVCRGLAAALVPATAATAASGPTLTLHVTGGPRPARDAGPGHTAADDILAFAAALDAARCGDRAHGGAAATPWSHACPWAAEFRVAAAAAEPVSPTVRSSAVDREAA